MMKTLALLLLLSTPLVSAETQTLLVSFRGRSYRFSMIGAKVELVSDYVKERLQLGTCPVRKDFADLWKEFEDREKAVTLLDLPKEKDETVTYDNEKKKGKVLPETDLGRMLRELPSRFHALAIVARMSCKKI